MNLSLRYSFWICFGQRRILSTSLNLKPQFPKTCPECGNAPELRKELSEIDLSAFVLIAADGAVAAVMDIGRLPEVIRTELTVAQS